MNWILIIIIALLFSAFFSGMEIAFVSSNKVRVELDMKQQGMMSKILGLFYGNEEQFISTMLVGNNIALVIYGMGMAALLEPVIALVWNQEAFVVLMQTLLSTLLILFVGEFLPKTIFRVNPNATMRFFSPFVWLLYVVLYPISKFTSVVSKCVMRLGGVKIAHQPYGALMSKIELDSFILKSIEESDSGEPVEPEMKIFQNALDFSNIHLRDCMIPRTNLWLWILTRLRWRSCYKRSSVPAYPKWWFIARISIIFWDISMHRRCFVGTKIGKRVFARLFSLPRACWPIS